MARRKKDVSIGDRVKFRVGRGTFYGVVSAYAVEGGAVVIERDDGAIVRRSKMKVVRA